MRDRSIVSLIGLLAVLLAAPVARPGAGPGRIVDRLSGIRRSRVARRGSCGDPTGDCTRSDFDRYTAVTTLTFSTPSGTQTQQMTRGQFMTDSTTVGTGVSALFYVWKQEALSAFVTPRYAYTSGTSTTAGSGTAGARRHARRRVGLPADRSAPSMRSAGNSASSGRSGSGTHTAAWTSASTNGGFASGISSTSTETTSQGSARGRVLASCSISDSPASAISISHQC